MPMDIKGRIHADGLIELGRIIAASGRRKSDKYWIFRATQIGRPEEFKVLHALYGDSPKNWDFFGQGLSPSTLYRFTTGKIVHIDALEILCRVFNEEVDEEADFVLERVAELALKPYLESTPKETEKLRAMAIDTLLRPKLDVDSNALLYGKAFRKKNVSFLGDTDYYFDAECLRISKGRLIEGCPNICEFEMSADIYGMHFPWGLGFVNTQTGRSELLLDNRSYFFTGHVPTIDNKKIRKIRIREKDISFTSWTIANLRKAYSLFTNGKKSIVSWGGFLEGTNLRYFRRNYQNSSGYVEDERDFLKWCFRNTPFGKHRIRAGINLIDLRIVERDYLSNIPSMVMVLDARKSSELNKMMMCQTIAKAKEKQGAYLLDYSQDA